MLKPHMKLLHLDRIYRINRIFFCSVWYILSIQLILSEK